MQQKLNWMTKKIIFKLIERSKAVLKANGRKNQNLR